MDHGEECYRRFLAGDEDAFAEILELYGKSLIFFLQEYVGNPTVAEDLMEDSFCELILHRNRFRGRSSLKTYLFAIARHKALDYLKKQRHLADRPIEAYASALFLEEELPDAVIREEENRRLYSAMNCISPDYRMVLHLLYFEEMSYEEAAYVLRKSSKQLKNLAYRARQSLKRQLEREGDPNENDK